MNDAYDFECCNCHLQFDIDESQVCPNCGSDDLLDLCEED